MLGVGTTHVCRCTAFPERYPEPGFGCGKEWDCGEADCRVGEHAKCPTCIGPHYTDHHAAALNQAKRDPEYATRLRRIMEGQGQAVAAWMAA